MKPKPQAMLCALARILAEYGRKDVSSTRVKGYSGKYLDSVDLPLIKW